MEAVCSSEMSTFKHVLTEGKLTLDEQPQWKAENLYVKEESNALHIPKQDNTNHAQ